MRLIALVQDAENIARTLRHLGLPSEAPPLAPPCPRAPVLAEPRAVATESRTKSKGFLSVREPSLPAPVRPGACSRSALGRLLLPFPNATTKDGRTVKAFNPLSRNERMLFEVLLAGEHALHGFTNRDLRQKLGRTPYPLASEADKQPAQVTRLLRRLHAHGLIAKIPHSRRWWVSLAGHRTMGTAIRLREVAYPRLFAAAA